LSWQILNLGQLVNVKGGKRLPKGAEYSIYKTEHPYIRVCDMGMGGLTTPVDELKYLRENIFNKISRYTISSQDVYISIAGTIGIVGIIPKELEGANLTENAAKLVIKDREAIDRDYLMWFLATSGRMSIQNQVKSTGQPKLALFRIEELEIPLPSLPEQKRIAVILDKAYSICSKRKQSIELVDKFLRDTYLTLFGDPVTNPKGWSVNQWSEVLTITNGKNQRKVEVDDGQYPIYGSGGEMGRSSDYLCPENTVIIGRKGNINKPILVREKFWNVDTAFGLSPKTKELSYNYLYWYCKFFNFEKLNKAVTIPSLIKVDLLQIKMPMPDLWLVNKFDSIVVKVESSLIKQKKSLEELNNCFNALSQKAFKGEL